MAGTREVRAIGPSAPLSDTRASAQRTVNMYLSSTESVGEDKQFILRPSTGGSSVVTCSGELRGMCSSPDGQFLYFVDGDAVKRRNSNTAAVSTLTGTLSTSTGPVMMAAGSGDQIVLVTGSKGYVVTASAVTEITDADFPDNADQVAYLDGYWIVNMPSQADQWCISAIDDPATWDALDFSSADRMPDRLTAIRVSKQEIYLFGERSTEIWYNSGAADFPFSRYTQAPIDIGIIGPYAACKTADSIAFIGRADNGVPMVYLFNGHTPRRISIRAVEERLSTLAFPMSDVRMWSYQGVGAEFIGVDLADPSGTDEGKLVSTWVYDISTGQWHERQQQNGSNYTQLESIDVVMHGGLPHMGLRFHDSGSTTSWRIFRLSDGTTWGDQTLRMERTWPHLVAPSAEAVRYSSVELLCQVGNTGETVTLEVSNDGGTTFGSPVSKALDGERLRWLFLGSARDRVFRLRSTAPRNWHAVQVEAG